MVENLDLEYKLIPYNEGKIEEYDLGEIIFDLDSEIDLLANKADKLDYLLAIASGLTCGLLDILWVGDFNLARGRSLASDKVDDFVKKTAELISGKKFNNLSDAVRVLEKKFPIPSDRNTNDFGGGLQHHLRDFAHHPTLVGLAFSILTQFTGKSYGTDINGNFAIFDVPENGKIFIGENIGEKLFMGVITWFFHLVSDMAGSSGTIGLGGGTGIPGPILSIAKEMSVLHLFKNINTRNGMHIFLFLSKLFNGTLFIKRDEKGHIIKESVLRFDLRGEFGLGLELGKQALPVLANECMVRIFYFIRHLAVEMREKKVKSLKDFKIIDWDLVKPNNNPTIIRMLTVSTGIFTSLDLGEAIITQKYWLSLNYVGIGRFALALTNEINYGLKRRNIKKIRGAYEKMKNETFAGAYYKKIGDKFGLSLKETEILYNIEYHLVLNDIDNFVKDDIFNLKIRWLSEWKKIISKSFESFTQVSGAEIKWYSLEKLHEKIIKLNPTKPWFRLVLFEAMLFEPYYPLRVIKDQDGKYSLSKEFCSLDKFFNKYNKDRAHKFLNKEFTGIYCKENYIDHLNKAYNKQVKLINKDFKFDIKTVSIAAVIATITVFTAGIFTGPIAVALVGSNFAGLSGAAITSASLAYLGGGAVALGGLGMAGGSIAIIGGGASLGLGLGAGLGKTISVLENSSRNSLINEAKLLTSFKEIFLNDERDLEFCEEVLETYTQNIFDLEKYLIKLKLDMDTLKGKDKKENQVLIKNAEDMLKLMKASRNTMIKIIDEFKKEFDY